MKSIEQKIAQKEAQLARLKKQSRALETGQKIIAGSIVLDFARKDERTRVWLINQLKLVTRPADKKRLEPLIEELERLQKPEDPKAFNVSKYSREDIVG